MNLIEGAYRSTIYDFRYQYNHISRILRLNIENIQRGDYKKLDILVYNLNSFNVGNFEILNSAADKNSIKYFEKELQIIIGKIREQMSYSNTNPFSNNYGSYNHSLMQQMQQQYKIQQYPQQSLYSSRDVILSVVNEEKNKQNKKLLLLK